MAQRFFISKNSNECQELIERFPDIQFTCESLISFNALEFDLEREIDVLFLSSPRSVLFFHNSHSIKTVKSIACVGTKTAEVLRAMDLSPDFVVEQNAEVERGVESFHEWLGGRHATFSLSSRSLRSYSKGLPKSQKQEVESYETVLNPKQIAPHDCYIFTSPSNAGSFYELNQLPESSKVIAWGSSTEKALKVHGVHSIEVLANSSIDELLKLLAKK